MQRCRPTKLALAALLLAAPAPAPRAQLGELQVEIQNLARETLFDDCREAVDVEGRATVFGGFQELDLFLVLDSSRSLYRTDPEDFRKRAAIALVQNLPEHSDIQLGLVEFNYDPRLISDLTRDRAAILRDVDRLERDGGTDLAGGILTAVDRLAQHGRPEAAHVVLLFTDGKSDAKKALDAARAARDRNVMIHTILLGDREKSADLLQSIARTAEGHYVYVEDPQELPRAFVELRTTGVEHVKLSVDGSPPIDTQLVAGTFRGRVPVREGANVIAATATDLHGETVTDTVTVTVTGPLRVAIREPIDGAVFEKLDALTDVVVDATVACGPGSRLPDLGIERVVLAATQAPPVDAVFTGGLFRGQVPLALQENRITARATSRDGREGQAFVDVTVRPPGCAELRVAAERDGRPAISLDDRGLEIIFDASNSMWGRIEGTPKITIAKDTLGQVTTGFPDDFFVALRVYGHRHDRSLRDCTDSELLFPLDLANAGRIRSAIAGFQPKGMTPLGYSIGRVRQDFGDFGGDRAVVLVTDGIESCDGDPVGAAQELQEHGVPCPIHVIAFALDADEDVVEADALRAIASVSGGRFFLAGNAAELRRALLATAGTPYDVLRGGEIVARGTLGVDESFRLPGGDYVLRLLGKETREFFFALRGEEALLLTLSKTGSVIETRESRRTMPYNLCE
jgi:Mg-chelatase subunit ChlD